MAEDACLVSATEEPILVTLSLASAWIAETTPLAKNAKSAISHTSALLWTTHANVRLGNYARAQDPHALSLIVHSSMQLLKPRFLERMQPDNWPMHLQTKRRRILL